MHLQSMSSCLFFVNFLSAFCAIQVDGAVINENNNSTTSVFNRVRQNDSELWKTSTEPEVAGNVTPVTSVEDELEPKGTVPTNTQIVEVAAPAATGLEVDDDSGLTTVPTVDDGTTENIFTPKTVRHEPAFPFIPVRAGGVPERELRQTLSVLTQADVTEDSFSDDITTNSLLENTKVTLRTPVFITEPLFFRTPPLFRPRIRSFIDNPEVINTTRRLGDWTRHVCGRSGVCDGNSEYICEVFDTKCHLCRCDDHCFRFGDCCPDKYEEITSTEAIKPDHHVCIPAVQKEALAMEPQRYLMIDKCLGEQASTNQSLVESCNSLLSPVYSPETKLHYKNRYCALCNGAQLTVPWLIKPACEASLDFSKIKTPTDFYTEAVQNPSCGIFFAPPDKTIARECSYDTTMISRCPDDYKNAADIRDCALYRHPVTLDDRKTYRNLFCAACHRRVFLRHVDSCRVRSVSFIQLYPYSTITDFNQILNTNSNNSTSDMCPPAEVFDLHQGLCRRLYCPLGKVVANHTCVDLFVSARGMWYRLDFALVPKRGNPVNLRVDMAEYLFLRIEDYCSTIPYIKTTSYTEWTVTVMYENPHTDTWREGLRVINVTFSVKMIVLQAVPKSEFEQSLVWHISRGWFFYNTDDDNPVEFETRWLPRQANEDDGVLKLDNVTHESRTFIWQKNVPNLIVPSPDSLAYRDLNELLLCNMIELSSEEYEMMCETKIRVKRTGQVLETGQFEKAEGSHVRVCTKFTGKMTQRDLQGFAEGVKENVLKNQPEALMIVIPMSISGIFILVTLIFSFYRRDPQSLSRELEIPLFVNLICAQVSFTISCCTETLPLTCSILGAMTHYFWISTFLWVLACCFQRYKMVVVSHQQMNACKRFWRSFVFCQCLPVFLVAFFITGHIFSTRTVGYGLQTVGGNGAMCFLSDNVSLISAYIAPLGVIFLVTAFFFLRTSLALHRDATSKSHVGIITFHFKLSLLLALIWAFGFAMFITHALFLFYTFIMFNASLGLLVFFSFFPFKSCFPETKAVYYPDSPYSNTGDKSTGPPSTAYRRDSLGQENIL